MIVTSIDDLNSSNPRNSSDPRSWIIGGDYDEVQKKIWAEQRAAEEAQNALIHSVAWAEVAPQTNTKTNWLPWALGGVAGVLLVIVLSNSKKR